MTSLLPSIVTGSVHIFHVSTTDPVDLSLVANFMPLHIWHELQPYDGDWQTFRQHHLDPILRERLKPGTQISDYSWCGVFAAWFSRRYWDDAGFGFKHGSSIHYNSDPVATMITAHQLLPGSITVDVAFPNHYRTILAIADCLVTQTVTMLGIEGNAGTSREVRLFLTRMSRARRIYAPLHHVIKSKHLDI